MKNPKENKIVKDFADLGNLMLDYEVSDEEFPVFWELPQIDQEEIMVQINLREKAQNKIDKLFRIKQ